MAADPLKGKNIRWSYSDGPVKETVFEHQFTDDGKVSWKFAGDTKASADSNAAYQFARIDDDVYVSSYLAGSGLHAHDGRGRALREDRELRVEREGAGDPAREHRRQRARDLI